MLRKTFAAPPREGSLCWPRTGSEQQNTAEVPACTCRRPGLRGPPTFSLVCPGMLPCNRLFDIPWKGTNYLGEDTRAMWCGNEVPSQRPALTVRHVSEATMDPAAQGILWLNAVAAVSQARARNPGK